MRIAWTSKKAGVVVVAVVAVMADVMADVIADVMADVMFGWEVILMEKVDDETSVQKM